MTSDKHLPIMTWIVKLVGELLSKYSIGTDRKTAYERIRGRTCDRPVAFIGEHIWYKPLDAQASDEEKADAHTERRREEDTQSRREKEKTWKRGDEKRNRTEYKKRNQKQVNRPEKRM